MTYNEYLAYFEYMVATYAPLHVPNPNPPKPPDVAPVILPNGRPIRSES